MLFAVSHKAEELRVLPGSQAIMSCVSETDVEIRKDKILIYSGGKFLNFVSSRLSLEHVGNHYYLVINNTSSEDSGVYDWFEAGGGRIIKSYQLNEDEGILAVFSIVHIYV